jgi:hypothetical protein
MQVTTKGYTAWDCQGCDKNCIQLIKDGYEPTDICNVKGGIIFTMCNWTKREKKYMQLVGDDQMG